MLGNLFVSRTMKTKKVKKKNANATFPVSGFLKVKPEKRKRKTCKHENNAMFQ